MNQLENRKARYRSNTWMGRTRTDGPDEFEPSSQYILNWEKVILKSSQNTLTLYLIETPFNAFASRADPDGAALVRKYSHIYMLKKFLSFDTYP